MNYVSGGCQCSWRTFIISAMPTMSIPKGSSIRMHKANSHKKWGWTKFTDAVIKEISMEHDGAVFILWGKQAQNKRKLIDTKKHKIVESAHPSGLSAHRGFFGSKPYSKCNAFLKEMGKEPINWQID